MIAALNPEKLTRGAAMSSQLIRPFFYFVFPVTFWSKSWVNMQCLQSELQVHHASTQVNIKAGSLRKISQSVCSEPGAYLQVGKDGLFSTYVSLNCQTKSQHGSVVCRLKVVGNVVKGTYLWRNQDPFDSLVPEIAKVHRWPSCEVNGLILVWFHCEGKEPEWTVPEQEEITSGQWVYRGRTEHFINAHIQVGADVCETILQTF